jgi:hypothetical protein
MMMMMMISIIGSFYCLEGLREGEGYFFGGGGGVGSFLPPFFISVAYTTVDGVTKSAPKPTYLGLHFRLIFQICMHCLHFSGI